MAVYKPKKKTGTNTFEEIKIPASCIDGLPSGSGVDLATVLNTIYPVGAIYLTMSYNFSPQTAFGGTWKMLSDDYCLQTTTKSGYGGSIVSAGLPDITGNLKGVIMADSYYYVAGAFANNSTKGTITRNYKLGESYTFNINTEINFKASIVNSIYGNSKTVQPPAIRVYAWQRTA